MKSPKIGKLYRLRRDFWFFRDKELTFDKIDHQSHDCILRPGNVVLISDLSKTILHDEDLKVQWIYQVIFGERIGFITWRGELTFSDLFTRIKDEGDL